MLHLDFSSAGTIDRIRHAVKNKDYIGVSLHSITAQYSARRTVRLVKAYNLDCVLLVGGPHITLDGRRFLEECPDVDIAVIGYGELTLVDILTQRPLHDIPGLMFREGDGIILNREREELIDLDALPYPDYSVFDTREVITSYHITTSRGCPYQCTYCAVPMMNGRRWRFRSVENIIDDIRSAEKEFDRFSIIDDTFTQNISRAKRFCAEYIKSGIDLTWELPCGIRANKLDEELVDLMKRAGCTRVALGIETFDETQ